MKILWLSNKVLSDQDNGATGTWLDAMAHRLIRSGEIELGNLAQGNVGKTSKQHYGQIHQWITPSPSKSCHGGLPPNSLVEQIVNAVEEFSPDLVHIWGTESFWGLLTARKLIGRPALLEMQGLKGAIAPVFHGGLTFREQLECIGPKEILRNTSIFQARKRFEAWGIFEREIITGHSFISAHSDWATAQVKAINSRATIFRNDRVLREPFYEFKPRAINDKPILFCSAAYPSPFKGLHIVIRSLAILKNRFPDIQLRIAGALQRTGIRSDGYIAWLNREAKRLKIESQICWLGPLSAEMLVHELRNCSVFLLASFVESYCVALAEAMILGVPSVVSYTGGTSFLALDKDSALFFPLGDERTCAYQVERLLSDHAMALHLSNRAREVAKKRNNRDIIINKQIEIYHQVLKANL